MLFVITDFISSLALNSSTITYNPCSHFILEHQPIQKHSLTKLHRFYIKHDKFNTYNFFGYDNSQKKQWLW